MRQKKLSEMTNVERLTLRYNAMLKAKGLGVIHTSTVGKLNAAKWWNDEYANNRLLLRQKRCERELAKEL